MTDCQRLQPHSIGHMTNCQKLRSSFDWPHDQLPEASTLIHLANPGGSRRDGSRNDVMRWSNVLHSQMEMLCNWKQKGYSHRDEHRILGPLWPCEAHTGRISHFRPFSIDLDRCYFLVRLYLPKSTPCGYTHMRSGHILSIISSHGVQSDSKFGLATSVAATTGCCFLLDYIN